MHAITRILVPTDFSESSREALEVASDLARKLDASLTVTHVWQLTPLAAAGMGYAVTDFIRPIIDAARTRLDAELAKLRGRVSVADAELRGGIAWSEILDVAEKRKADLIVMGTHGRTGFRRALLGSTAEKVVRMSSIPVLTVRLPNAPAETAAHA